MTKSLFIKNISVGFSIFLLVFAILFAVKPAPVFADDDTPVWITSDINYGHTFTKQYSDFGGYLYYLLEGALTDSGYFDSSSARDIARDFLYRMNDLNLNAGPFANWTPDNPTFYCNATLLFSGNSFSQRPYIYILFFPTSGYVDLDEPFVDENNDAYSVLPSSGPYYIGKNTYNDRFPYMFDPYGAISTSRFFTDNTEPNHMSYWLPYYVKAYPLDTYHNDKIRLYNDAYDGSSSYGYNADARYYRGDNTRNAGFLAGSSFTDYSGCVYSFPYTSSLDSTLYTSFEYGLTYHQLQGLCLDLTEYMPYSYEPDPTLYGVYFRDILYPVYVGRDYSEDDDISLQGFRRQPLFSMGYTYNLSSIGDVAVYNAGSGSSNYNIRFAVFSELMYTDPVSMRAALLALPGYTEAFRISDTPPVTPGAPTPTPIPGYNPLTPTPFPTYTVSATVTPITISSNPDFDIDTGSLFGDIKGYISIFTDFLNGSVFAWAREIFQRFVTFGSDPIFSVLVFLPVIGLIAFILGRLLFK